MLAAGELDEVAHEAHHQESRVFRLSWSAGGDRAEPPGGGWAIRCLTGANPVREPTALFGRRRSPSG